ncbi:hypothetical protein [Aureimonas sp. AU22]|jgi:hypothetical protein|uniref:hypothetical protein n=1 Tax=Aureimonas sp. AU22 TaxID=1638162 RepID=UPI000AFF5628|nr:hypothetical protein [Aureimonas sp. AU22]
MMMESKGALSVASGTKRLADAVRAAKIASSQRTDIVIDIREADRARLEIFAEELQPIIDAVPAGDDLFDFTLSGGPQPRFWIDGTAQVLMARDRRTYRFVRDTRLGRVTLAESSESHVIVDKVTEYVAERMVERDRAFAASDGIGLRPTERPAAIAAAATLEPIRLAPRPRSTDFVIALSWLMIGIVVGAGILMAIAAYRGAPLV